MKTLRSYLGDRWVEGSSALQTLVNPATEEPLAQVSSDGLDIAAALEHSRRKGGPALRALGFAERGNLLKEMAKAIQAHRDELLDLAVANGGNTRSDAKFDVDGAIFTLQTYAEIGASLGAAKFLIDGEGVQLGRSPRFHGQHINVPRQGVAVQINAFNFPAWGLAEKAASALLAGMPVLSKPATSSAMVAHRVMEIVVEKKVLPDGALSLLVGAPRDLRDMTQKAGQKCTAIRRVLVPAAHAAALRDDLAEGLNAVRVGNPALEETRMGPLATGAQLADVREGVAKLGIEGKSAFGSAAPLPGKGFFISPVLMEFARDALAASVHAREVFGPVASLLPYSGKAADAAAIVARGNGGLVSSVYSEDAAFLEEIVAGIAPYHGRLFLGHPKIEMSPGPGTVLPQLVHGGPGRAGGGEELGGARGLAFYMQRVALEGSRPVIQKLIGAQPG